MNRYVLAVLAVSAAAIGGQAFADDITIDPNPFVSTRTRAEVKAELAQYKKDGVDLWSETAYNPLKHFKSTASRDQVTAAYVASRDEVAALNGEDSGSAYLAQNHGIGRAGGTVLAAQSQQSNLR